MKQYNEIKKYVTALALAIIFVCGSALAQPPAAPPKPGTIKLEAFLGTLYTDTLSYFHSYAYQKDPSVVNTTQLNTVNATPTATHYSNTEGDPTSSSVAVIQSATQVPISTTAMPPMEAASKKAAYETLANIQDTLKQFPYTFNIKNPDVKKWQASDGKLYSAYLGDNTVQNLTVGTETTLKACEDAIKSQDPKLKNMQCAAYANDTLFSKNMTGVSTANEVFVAKPPAFDADRYFDFATLFTPKTDETYTPTEEAAANQFLKYAAQSTQDFTSDFTSSSNFQKLITDPNKIAALKHQPQFQNYIFDVRNILALRSISIGAMNELIAERTPIQGLGTSAGVQQFTSNSSGKITATPVANASPLEVEAYRANHRIEDPNWYKQIENASPATIQRNTLMILAEIEHQNYQAHLDRERLIAAVTALNLQMASQNASTFTMQQQQPISEAINNALGIKTTTPPPPQSNTMGTPPQNNATTTTGNTTSNNKQ